MTKEELKENPAIRFQYSASPKESHFCLLMEAPSRNRKERNPAFGIKRLSATLPPIDLSSMIERAKVNSQEARQKKIEARKEKKGEIEKNMIRDPRYTGWETNR